MQRVHGCSGCSRHQGHTRAMVCHPDAGPSVCTYPPDHIPALANNHASLGLRHQQPVADVQAGPSVAGLHNVRDVTT